jgi:hypothetical protein
LFNDGVGVVLFTVALAYAQGSGQEGLPLALFLTLVNSEVTGNFALGGVIWSSGHTTVLNTTISGNSSEVPYPSAISQDGGSLTLLSSTVGPGSSTSTTISLDGAVLSTTNSVIVASNGSRACGDYLGGPWSGNLFSGGGNIESPGDTCYLTDLGHPTDLVNVTAEDLNLGPLADNGGPTMTHALLPGSVAIDKIPSEMCVDAEGEPLTTDQRGFTRPVGDGCDVGAFEVQP